MDIFLTAHLKPVADFLATYRTGDATRVDAEGRGLLLMALQNKDLASRYAIADFLLDHGAPVETSGNNGATVLHVLFGQVSHDLARDENLARRLIDRGATINATDLDGRLPFVDVLAMKFTDDQLRPIYDLWFAQRAFPSDRRREAAVPERHPGSNERASARPCLMSTGPKNSGTPLHGSV